MMGLVDLLQVVMLGIVTGGIGATVTLAWLLRRGGEPTAQGRWALLYILASTVTVLVFGVWLILD
jgi:hypothetical protein